MENRITVTAKVSVEGLHCWPGAPMEVCYLQNLHRHVFVIRCEKEVHHDDRDVEFISFAHEIDNHLFGRFYKGSSNILNFGSYSCEQIAAILVNEFDLVSCSVFEDDENGATVTVPRKE